MGKLIFLLVIYMVYSIPFIVVVEVLLDVEDVEVLIVVDAVVEATETVVVAEMKFKVI